MPSSMSGAAAGGRRRPYAPRLPPEQRREQLLDAALGLIVDNGYAGVSIEAVARRCGVTRPVVYDHFKNLGLLLQALLDREEALAQAELDGAVPVDADSDDAAEAVISGIALFVAAVLRRPQTWQIILLPADGTPEVIRAQTEKYRERMRRRIARQLERTVEVPGFDLELASYSILHLAEEAGRLVLTDPVQFSPERFERFVRAVVGFARPRDAPAH